jgi:hypothetical protein
LGVLAEVKQLGMPLLSDMQGCTGTEPFMYQGYQVIAFS